MFLLDCNDYGNLSVIYTIKNILNIICVLIPVILTIVIVIKLTKMTLSDEDKTGVLVKWISIRMFAAFAIFMLPAFASVIFDITGSDGSASACWKNATLIKLNSAKAVEEAKEAQEIAEYQKYKEEHEKTKKLLEEAQRKKDKENHDKVITGDRNSGGSGDSTAASNVSYVKWALDIAADNSHGYSQASRTGVPDYDCSSLVYYALINSGYNVQGGPFTTFYMEPILTGLGFKRIQASSVDDLQEGDILLNSQTHTEIYIGNNQRVGAHRDWDGRSGDSTGNEISVVPMGDVGFWEMILRGP